MGFISKIFGSKKGPLKNANETRKSYIVRDGVSIEADERFKAWVSSDLGRMLEQLPKKGHPVDTHFLYLNIVEQTYKQRKNPKMRELFKKVASEHVSRFGSLVDPLIKDMGILPRVPTFQYLATVYTEDGEYDKAIQVCEKAIEIGLQDGTKSGFQGRIERIRKKM